MKIQVVYKSNGNNKKLAMAIAQKLQVEAKRINEVDDVEADILFLGCAILGGNVPVQVSEFVERLEADKVRKVVLFSANGHGIDQFGNLKTQLQEKNIVCGPVFSCKGSAFIFMNLGHPNKNDLEAIKDFAENLITSMETKGVN